MLRTASIALTTCLVLAGCAHQPTASDEAEALGCSPVGTGGAMVTPSDTPAGALGAWLGRSGRTDLRARAWHDGRLPDSRQYLVFTTSGAGWGVLIVSPLRGEPGWSATVLTICPHD